MLRFSEDWDHMNGYQLYLLGLDPDTEWDPDPDIEWDPRIVDRFLEVGSGYYLYWAGVDWSNDKYDSRIAQALMDTKEMDYIRAALGKSKYTYIPWSPERIRDIVMAWQGV